MSKRRRRPARGQLKPPPESREEQGKEARVLRGHGYRVEELAKRYGVSESLITLWTSKSDPEFRREAFETIRIWWVQHGKPPTTEDLQQADMPSLWSLQREFGSLGEAIESTRHWLANHYWTRERVITAIQDWALEHHGTPPSHLEFENQKNPAHYPSDAVVRNRFGKWNNAIRAAGFVPLPQSVTRQAVERLLPLPRNR